MCNLNDYNVRWRISTFLIKTDNISTFFANTSFSIVLYFKHVFISAKIEPSFYPPYDNSAFFLIAGLGIRSSDHTSQPNFATWWGKLR